MQSTPLKRRFCLGVGLATFSIAGVPWVGAVGLMGATAITLAIASPAQAAVLSDWEFNADTYELEITVPGGTTPRYFLAAEPARIVLDLPDTQVGSVQTTQSYGGAVRQIRVAQFAPGLTRIVLELAPDAVLAVGQVELKRIGSGNGQSSGSGQSGDRWVLRPLLAAGSSPAVAASSPTQPASPPAQQEQSAAAVRSVSPAVPSNVSSPATATASSTVSPVPDSSVGASNRSSHLPPLEPGATEIPVQMPSAPVATSPTVETAPTSGASSIPATTPAPAANSGIASSATLPPATLPPATLPPAAGDRATTVSVPSLDSASIGDSSTGGVSTVRRSSASSASSTSVPSASASSASAQTETAAKPSQTEPAIGPPVSNAVNSASQPPPALPPANLSSGQAGMVSVPSLDSVANQESVAASSASASGASPAPPSVPVAPTSSASVAASPVNVEDSSVARSIEFGQPIPSQSASLQPASSQPASSQPIPSQPIPSQSLPQSSPQSPSQPSPQSPSQSAFNALPPVEPDVAVPQGTHSDSPSVVAAPTPGTILLRSGTVLSLRYPGEKPLELTANQPRQEVLLLDEAIRDRTGNVILPKDSQVIGRFETDSNGSKFIVQAITLQGQNVPLKAESAALSGNRQMSNNSLLRNSALGVLAGALLGGITGIGLIAGLAAGAAGGAAGSYFTTPPSPVIQPNQIVEVRLMEDLKQ